MSQYARVNSVVLLKLLKASLATFADTASVALDEVGTDIQRTLAWLNEDRRRYWANQVHVCTERVVQAKLALKQKGIFDRALSGTKSSAVEERKALAIAERRLREAEAKLSRTRSWIQQIEKLHSDYRGGVQGLVSAIDADVPNAGARLDKMIDALEAYVALAPPETSTNIEEALRESVLRPEPEPSLLDLRETARTLRSRTPAPQVRTETPLAAEVPEWVSGISLPDAWVHLDPGVHQDRDYATAPALDDRVLVERIKGPPDVVFLVRTRARTGDSGWSIGSGTKTESQGYVAVHVADLSRAQPQLQDVLNLPEGSLVVMDLRKATSAVFDADDNVLWPSSGGDAPAPTE